MAVALRTSGEGSSERSSSVQSMRHSDVSLPLRVTLDPNADAAYAYLTDVPAGAAVTHRVVGVAARGDVVLDFDRGGRLLGVC